MLYEIPFISLGGLSFTQGAAKVSQKARFVIGSRMVQCPLTSPVMWIKGLHRRSDRERKGITMSDANRTLPAVTALHRPHYIPLQHSLLALITAVLALVLGTSDAYAQGAIPTTVLNDATGAPGGQFNVAGTGFTPDTTLELRLVVGRNIIPLGDVSSDHSGTLGPTPRSIPGTVAPGTYGLEARNSLGGLAASSAMVVRPPVTLELPPSAQSGSSVDFSIDNLAPGMVQLRFNGATVIGPVPVSETSFDGSFIVPAQDISASSIARVEAINTLGTLLLGSANANFNVGEATTPSSHRISNASFASTNLVPGDEFVLTGKLDPPPSDPDRRV